MQELALCPKRLPKSFLELPYKFGSKEFLSAMSSSKSDDVCTQGDFIIPKGVLRKLLQRHFSQEEGTQTGYYEIARLWDTSPQTG